MISFILFIIGYLLIFISLFIFFLRVKEIRLSIEDYAYWKRIERRFNFLKNKILGLIKISEGELIHLWKNFLEKILRRIKIEALKIETWANKKLEGLKNNNTLNH